MNSSFAVSDEVRTALSEATIEGNTVRIERQLPRQLYLQVNRVLSGAGGRWDRKARAHLFDRDPRELLGLARSTGQALDVKKFYQSFYTPPDLAMHMARWLNVRPRDRVLEPSAGAGALCDAVRELQPTARIHCWEIDPAAVSTLRAKGYEVTDEDFLASRPRADFNRIVMNPPFSGGQDLRHVTHALRFLAPGGRLVTITSPAWKHSSNRRAIAFREIVKQNSGYAVDLPAGTFGESGTNVRAVLLLLERSVRARSSAGPVSDP